MIASTFIFIFKIVGVVATLAAMVMLLVGIRHLVTGFPGESDAETLRKEVDDVAERGVSSHNLFHQFINPNEPLSTQSHLFRNRNSSRRN